MRTRGLTVVSAILATGMLTTGAGVAAATVVKSAARVKPAARAAAATAGRGVRKLAKTTEAALASSPGTRVSAGICSAPAAQKALAVQLSAGIQAALRGRAGNHAVTVYDAVTGASCHANDSQHFASASIVKALILATLLRWHQEDGRALSSWEQGEATRMITQSDNNAATALWNEVGASRLQHFLNLAAMSQTHLGTGGYWGLTQVTAHDEMLLLKLLTLPNPVLSPASRAYQLGLMARVTPSQRWGTPAGAPSGVTAHVKNGWLPESDGWHINSLGAFTGKGKNYLIVVLTDDNPSEGYGIDTVENVARVVHRDLNAAGPASSARLAANVAPTPTASAATASAATTQGQPSSWAWVPALPTPPQPLR
jgi:beta-lactamase class A